MSGNEANDLLVSIQVRAVDYDENIADCDDAVIGLLSEGHKLARKMLAANERGRREAQFCSGAVRVTVSRTGTEEV